MQNALSRVSAPRRPSRLVVEPIVRTALLEDLAHGSDITTDAIVPTDLHATAAVVTREQGVVAGIHAAILAFELLDPGATKTHVIFDDGCIVKPGTTIAEITGRARTLLTGERAMLNILSRLSGIATATYGLVETIRGTAAQIVDTRKTTPGLRALEKFAVRCGGGSNHRFGLDDAVLIKDNHLALAGSIREAVSRAHALAGHMVKIEVEVDTLEQLHEALAEPIDAVLLDNMTPEMLKRAVEIVDRRLITEASGGIRPETVRAVAESGVDLISVGWLTHGAPSLDFGLDIVV